MGVVAYRGDYSVQTIRTAVGYEHNERVCIGVIGHYRVSDNIFAET